MPCEVEDIPIVDAVIISHSHYDHLSHPTIMKLKEKHPNVHFFAPLGNKKWFTACGVSSMTELDWWESRDMKLSPAYSDGKDQHQQTDGAVVEPPKKEKPSAGQTIDEVSALIGCLPCQHTSGRTPFDKSRTLWSSWSVESGGKKIWFGGWVFVLF